MTSNYKVSGVWKQTIPYIKVSSIWKTPKSAWTKINGTWKSWFLQGGVLDTGFLWPTSGISSPNQYIISTSIQSDEKILIGGFFRIFNGINVNNLIRLNTDETLDTSFNTNLGSGFNNSIYSIAIQPSDGKILVAGYFTTFNGNTRNGLIRLNADGTEDTTFATNIGTGFNNPVNSITIQPSDGKILVGGDFSTFKGVTRNRLVRLNADGTEDTTFYSNIGTGFNNSIYSIAIQPSDGKILVGGSFDIFNGNTRNRLVRLNADGTEDTTFATNISSGFNDLVLSIAVQPSDGKILVGGNFTTFKGVGRNNLVRLNSNGTEDITFYSNLGTGFNININSITIQPDNKILVGGYFNALNASTRNGLVRLNADGTEDTIFYTNLNPESNTGINVITIQSDGKILIGGQFTHFNGNSSFVAARIGGDIAV